MYDDSTQDDSYQRELQELLVKKLEIPALANPAIVRCREAMNRVAEETMETLNIHDEDDGQSASPDESEGEKLGPEERYSAIREGIKDACKAYREAMPPLTGAQNIRDFIACVGHGMLTDVFQTEEASKLLYAAQVASSAESRRSRARIG